MSENSAGKLLIDKLGNGERSPNLYDAVAMAFAPRGGGGGWFNQDIEKLRAFGAAMARAQAGTYR